MSPSSTASCNGSMCRCDSGSRRTPQPESATGCRRAASVIGFDVGFVFVEQLQDSRIAGVGGLQRGKALVGAGAGFLDRFEDLLLPILLRIVFAPGHRFAAPVVACIA